MLKYYDKGCDEMKEKFKKYGMNMLGVAICFAVAGLSVFIEKLIPGELLGSSIIALFAGTIINSFLENYDFTGKKIIPFATSGSSGMGETNKYLADSCKGAILVEGKRFGRPSWDELNNWINSL